MRQISIAAYVELIRAEYRESPGLCLTKSQIQRLWQLDPSACEDVVSALLEEGVLRPTTSGAYVRADAAEMSSANTVLRRPRPLPKE